DDRTLARLARGRTLLAPQITPDPALDALPAPARKALIATLEAWLIEALAPLDPLRKLEAATTAPEAGPELRALLIRLIEAGGMMERSTSGLDHLDKGQRTMLARLGLRVGGLDLFVPGMLRSAALAAWRELGGGKGQAPDSAMPPTLAATGRTPPPGYRALGKQWLRLDMAEKLLRDAHAARIAAVRRPFTLDPAKAVSMGLSTASYAQVLRLAGFQPLVARSLRAGAHGPPAPLVWRWRPPRRQAEPQPAPPPRAEGAFAALAELVR
ncbi:MAG: helicase, partial [Sphingomonadales bacterium]|nr:helicase [Sphingomonadales bacterium]